jgi:branched-chain amino acid transport system substrate-binding protein
MSQESILPENFPVTAGQTSSGLGRRRFLKKIALAFAATTVPAGLLAACGDNTPTTAPATTTSATTAASNGSATTAAAGATTAAAASGTPIKVGVLITFTGPYTQIGNDVLDGVNLYFSGLGNAVAGRPIQIIKEDEGATPENALQRARKLVEQDKVDFIVGISLTNSYLAMRDFIHQSKTILIVANAGANAISGDKYSNYIFHSSFGNAQYTYPTGDYAFKNIGKTAFELAPEYAAGHEALDGFKAGFTKAGGNVVKQVFSVLGQTTDFAPFLSQVQDAKPDLTFAFYSGTDTINFIKQYDQFGLKKSIPLAGSFAIDANALSQMGDAAIGTVYALTWVVELDTPTNKKFIADYQAKYNKLPGSTVVFGYDAAAMIAETLKATNGDTSDKDKLATAMGNVKLTSPRGPISISPVNHGLVQNIYIFQVAKGDNGKTYSKLVKTYENVPELADLLAKGLPAS